ncbi:MAG: rod shape-determining protein MreD [Acidothermus cellulolyticus]|nr:rod shape-determining protein MreD [Acidothermus cellulolyticus]
MGRATRTGLFLGLVLLAILLDATVLGPLDLPGAPPSLLLLVVAAWALVTGPSSGAVAGFVAGFVADVVPPADHLIGRYALAACLVGYLAGLFRLEAKESVAAALGAVALAVSLGTLVFAGSGVIFGEAAGTGGALPVAVASSVGYDLLLTPFVVPPITSLVRRLQPAVSRD